jgi:MFS transporter, DHA1 family, multidrug resistance protein
MIFANIFGLYALEKFGFGLEDVGVMMMVLGLVSALAQGMLAGPLTKKLGDELVTKVGLFATAIGFGLLLLANTYVTILLATAFFALTVALQVPALTSLTSRRATVPQGHCDGAEQFLCQPGTDCWTTAWRLHLRYQHTSALYKWCCHHGHRFHREPDYPQRS